MTQCVLSKKLRNVNKQYCGMLGLKINSKVWALICLLRRWLKRAALEGYEDEEPI